jgi:8-hydroxy-5-deazaflavin:NADPH oxidoreductase
MQIGIIGVGNITLDFACRTAKAGYEVLMYHLKGNTVLMETVRLMSSNVKLVSKYQAATAEIVFLFIPHENLEILLSDLPDMNGKILLHTNNPVFNLEYFSLDDRKKSSSEIIASIFPNSYIIKVFNVLEPSVILPYVQEQNKNKIFCTASNEQVNSKVKAFFESLNFSAHNIAEIYRFTSLN